MLDYKDIITKHYALGMSGTKIAESLKVSKSGVNDFLKAFRECPMLLKPCHSLFHSNSEKTKGRENHPLVILSALLLANIPIVLSSAKQPVDHIERLDPLI